MEPKHAKRKGQVSIMVAVISGAGMILASAVTSFGITNTKVQVIEERENNHYLEVKQQLDRIERKFDNLGLTTSLK